MEYSQSQDGIDDGWPWNCARCGRTIYHDTLTCRECTRTARAANVSGVGRNDRPFGVSPTRLRRLSSIAVTVTAAALVLVVLLVATLSLGDVHVGPVAQDLLQGVLYLRDLLPL